MFASDNLYVPHIGITFFFICADMRVLSIFEAVAEKRRLQNYMIFSDGWYISR